jgi:hypothetical protein
MHFEHFFAFLLSSLFVTFSNFTVDSHFKQTRHKTTTYSKCVIAHCWSFRLSKVRVNDVCFPACPISQFGSCFRCALCFDRCSRQSQRQQQLCSVPC